jgi:intergrase/recombinase
LTYTTKRGNIKLSEGTKPNEIKEKSKFQKSFIFFLTTTTKRGNIKTTKGQHLQKILKQTTTKRGKERGKRK